MVHLFKRLKVPFIELNKTASDTDHSIEFYFPLGVLIRLPLYFLSQLLCTVDFSICI